MLLLLLLEQLVVRLELALLLAEQRLEAPRRLLRQLLASERVGRLEQAPAAREAARPLALPPVVGVRQLA